MSNLADRLTARALELPPSNKDRDLMADAAEHLRENERLRAELQKQWEAAHAEYCDNQWPHPGRDCHWPRPTILAKQKEEDQL